MKSQPKKLSIILFFVIVFSFPYMVKAGFLPSEVDSDEKTTVAKKFTCLASLPYDIWAQIAPYLHVYQIYPLYATGNRNLQLRLTYSVERLFIDHNISDYSLRRGPQLASTLMNWFPKVHTIYESNIRAHFFGGKKEIGHWRDAIIFTPETFKSFSRLPLLKTLILKSPQELDDQSVSDLPNNLTNLELNISAQTIFLPEFPNLKRLSLNEDDKQTHTLENYGRRNHLIAKNLDKLPKTLTSLHLKDDFQWSFFLHLTSLYAARIEEFLPPYLNYLRIEKGNLLVEKLPPTLTFLFIEGGSLIGDISTLPSQLTSLRVSVFPKDSFKDLPPTLKSLRIYFLKGGFQDLPPNLEEFRVSSPQDIQQITAEQSKIFPRSLKTLEIGTRPFEPNAFLDLPPDLIFLSILRGNRELYGQNEIKRLPKSLRVLHIESGGLDLGSGTASAVTLPPKLMELNVSFIERVSHFPPSLRILRVSFFSLDSSLPVKIFRPLSALEYLDVGHNKLTVEHFQFLSPSLRELIIPDYNLQKMKEIFNFLPLSLIALYSDRSISYLQEFHKFLDKKYGNKRIEN